MKESEVVSVLVVDDDDVAAGAVARCMRVHSLNCPIVIAEDGRAALSILRGTHATKRISRPYLILLDLNMPRMNGVDFLRDLRSDVHLRGSVVFVLTTSASPDDLARAYQECVAGYMVKSDLGPQLEELARFLVQYGAANVLPQ
jgi:CheY-like chemotaxis protein